MRAISLTGVPIAPDPVQPKPKPKTGDKLRAAASLLREPERIDVTSFGDSASQYWTALTQAVEALPAPCNEFRPVSNSLQWRCQCGWNYGRHNAAVRAAYPQWENGEEP